MQANCADNPVRLFFLFRDFKSEICPEAKPFKMQKKHIKNTLKVYKKICMVNMFVEVRLVV